LKTSRDKPEVYVYENSIEELFIYPTIKETTAVPTKR
jgi:hypothetical protein